MLALVTGAGTGIGAACALALAADGYDVIVHCSSSEDGAHRIEKQIKEMGRNAYVFCVDFSDSDAVHRFAGGVMAGLGCPDVIVNNAGVCKPAQIQDITEDDWDRLMNVNLKAAFLLCRDFSSAMIGRRSGCIINIASIWGRTGASMESSYCASKGALVMFTKSLAQELGPSGIRANCVSPGCIDTAMNAGYSEEERRDLEERTPLGRFGTPEDIANAVSFLASEKAAFITGADLLVDGGFTI